MLLEVVGEYLDINNANNFFCYVFKLTYSEITQVKKMKQAS